MKKSPAPVQPYQKISNSFRRNLPSITLLLIGFIAGILWFGANRFFLYHSPETHYHANYAVYVDGNREEFKSFTYYEEVAACTTAFADNPKGRTHMHSKVNDVIHVHDKAVTYANFFENIDWTLGPNFVRTADGLVSGSEEKSWVFMLNGQKVDRVDNVVIGDQDKLLVSYGAPDTDYQGQYNKIENKAEQVDATADPSSCSGVNGPHDNSVSARLKKVFTFTN